MLLRLQNYDTGVFFILAKDGTLTVDFNSTIFNNQDQLLGKYSYPGGMPLEPNRQNINNAHYIATDADLRVLNVMMWLGNLPFKLVKMEFSIEDGTINYTLYIDISVIINQLKTLKLNQLVDNVNDEIFLPGSLSEFRDRMTDSVNAAPGTFPYVFFPYKNDGAYIDAAYVTTPVWVPGEHYLVDAIFLYTNNRIYQVTRATDGSQNPIDDIDYFMPLTSYPDSALPVSKIINRWELADDGTGNFVVDLGFPARQTQTPFFFLVYVLKRIAKKFGFLPVGDWLNEEEANRIVIFTNVPISFQGQIPNYTNFMPDMLVTDFLKLVRTKFGLLIDPDPTRGIWIIESLSNLAATDEIIDLQQQQTKGYRETNTQSQSFTITQAFDDKDEAFTEDDKKNPATLIIGNPNTAVQATDIQLGDAPTKMITEQSAVPFGDDLPIVTNWKIPYIKMKIAGQSPMDQISELAFADRYDFNLRFLYYQGLQPDDGGYMYPLGSSDNTDISGRVISNFTLALNSGGTAFLSVQNYYQFLKNSKPFEMLFELNRTEFLELRNNRRVIIGDFNNAAVSCIIDQISADFTSGKETVLTKLTLYPQIIPMNQVEVMPVPPVVPPDPPFDNGTVFLALFQENPTHFDSPIPPHYRTFLKDLIVRFYEDAGATTPKDVTRLDVRYKVQQYNDTFLHSEVVIKVTLTSTGFEYMLEAGAPDTSSQGVHSFSWVYTMMPSAFYTIL